MLTLTAVIVWLALGWLLPGLTLSLLPGTTLPDDLVGTLLGLAAAVIALCSWQDLAPTRERWRTPFASAVAYIGGFSLYAAMLPTQLALVAGLTLAGPVAFLAEFAVALAAPLALLAMPGMKAMLDPELRPARRPAWDAPRQAMLRCVVALVVGFICMAANGRADGPEHSRGGGFDDHDLGRDAGGPDRAGLLPVPDCGPDPGLGAVGL